MNIQLWKSIFPKSCYSSYYHSKINSFLFASAKFYSKKPYIMKNKFAFSDELKKVDLENPKTKIYSSRPSNDQNKYDIESNLNFTGDFVSADLLSLEKNRIPQKTILSHKRKERKPSLFYQGEILFGVHPVHLALLQKRRTFYQLFAREDLDSSSEDSSKKNEIISLARDLNIPISFVDSRALKILTPDAVHQGICLDAGFLPLPLWNEDQDDVKISEKNPLWLVLDEIIDPMNVGAIIRSAYYFGVNKLFTVRGNSCKLSPTVSKASSGVLEVMDIHQIGNLEEFVIRRKDSGWSVISTLAYSAHESKSTKSISAEQLNTSKPTILILGNEGKGIPKNILKLCDSLISIEPGQVLPQGIDSLNVSVAAGVILYALNNSRNKR